MQLNLADIIVLVFLAAGLFGGVKAGLSGELARLISYTLATLAGLFLYRETAYYLGEYTRLESAYIYIAGFILTTAVVLLIILFIRWILRQLVEFKFKGLLETVGGGLMGMARYTLLLLIAAVMLLIFAPVSIHQVAFEESSIATYLESPARGLWGVITNRYPDISSPVPQADTNTVESADTLDWTELPPLP